MTVGWSELREILRAALSDFDACDRQLLAFQANERSITHKLAEYIRYHLDRLMQQTRSGPPELAVDCEYNRIGIQRDPKRLPWDHELLYEDGGAYYIPYPDIIVHHRGDRTKNVLAIEVKLDSNGGSARLLIDRMKLAGYISEPTQYQFGLFLVLGSRRQGTCLHAAKLVDQSDLTEGSNASRVSIWTKCKNLVTDDINIRLGKQCGFKEVNSEMNQRATLLLEEFDHEYGFKDVTSDFNRESGGRTIASG
jgi:hypothetical protein